MRLDGLSKNTVPNVSTGVDQDRIVNQVVSELSKTVGAMSLAPEDFEYLLKTMIPAELRRLGVPDPSVVLVLRCYFTLRQSTLPNERVIDEATTKLRSEVTAGGSVEEERIQKKIRAETLRMAPWLDQSPKERETVVQAVRNRLGQETQ